MTPKDLKSDRDRLRRAYLTISQMRSKFDREHTLVMTAKFHGLPISRMEKLYKIWLAEREMEGGDV